MLDVMTKLAIGLGINFPMTIILATVIHRYRFGSTQDLDFIHGTKSKRIPKRKIMMLLFLSATRIPDGISKILLPYLEAVQCVFHLCIHDRDFVHGVAITKNTMTAVQYSCRTILVLTPECIKSG